MGRASRQQRRAQARRSKQPAHPSRRVNWQVVAGIGVVLAALALFGAQIAGVGKGAQSASSKLPVIDGIGCNAFEGTGYHQHAHLGLYVRGKRYTIPSNIGSYPDCLYWVHTHDGSGVIHMEAPSNVKPTLGTVFDIWGEPGQTISRSQIFAVRPKRGQSMRIFLNGKPYGGNPKAIRLVRHTDVTVEIGPPFIRPPKMKWGNL